MEETKKAKGLMYSSMDETKKAKKATKLMYSSMEETKKAKKAKKLMYSSMEETKKAKKAKKAKKLMYSSMEAPKKEKKLMSMLGEEEEEGDSWRKEEDGRTSSYVSDSFDEPDSKEEDSRARGKKRGRALCDYAAADTSLFRLRKKGKNIDKEKEKEKEKEKVEDRVNPDDYPELAKFVKLGVVEEEAQRNWVVIGNENAAMLQKRWIQIMDKQLHLSLWKTDLIKDIVSFITDSQDSSH